MKSSDDMMDNYTEAYAYDDLEVCTYGHVNIIARLRYKYNVNLADRIVMNN